MTNLPVFDLDFMLRANQDPDYSARMRLRYNVLRKLLLDNDLVLEECIRKFSAENEWPRIDEMDLNLEGRCLLWGGAIDRWFNGHDRGREIENTTVFERELRKLGEIGARKFLRNTNYYNFHGDEIG